MRAAAFVFAVCLLTPSVLRATPDPATRALIEAGHWKQARAVLEPRVKANALDAEAAALLSSVRLAFGDLGAALALAEIAVKLEGRNAHYHWQLAQVCGEQAQRANVFKQIGLARRFKQEAEQAIALDPKHVDARIGLIVFYIAAPGIVGGDRKKADVMADEIAKIDPASGFMARARVITEAKETGDVEALYRQAADAAQTVDVRYDARGALLNRYLSGTTPRMDLAEQQARELLKLDPHRPSGYTGIAIVQARAGRWTELDQTLVEAERAVPDNFAPFFQAGRTLLLGGVEWPRAERYFRTYLGQEPEAGATSLAVAHWRLGLVLEKQGKRAEAIAEVEEAARLNPSLEQAKNDLKRLRSS